MSYNYFALTLIKQTIVNISDICKLHKIKFLNSLISSWKANLRKNKKNA